MTHKSIGEEMPFSHRYNESTTSLLLGNSDDKSADHKFGDAGVEKMMKADWSFLKKL